MNVLISKKANFDWEPAEFIIRSIFQQELSQDTLFTCLSRWLQNRKFGCICDLTYLKVDSRQTGDGQVFVVSCEWLCDKCLQPFIDFMISTTPEVISIGLGQDENASLSHVRDVNKYHIQVPSQEVELESGAKTYIDAFKIARFPVTVGDFRSFAISANYETVAERNEDFESCYFKNSTLMGHSDSELMQSPVSCVSYEDAVAYCNSNALRLPTELEWIAAAVIEIGEVNDLEFREQIQRLSRYPNFLQQLGTELTGTLAGQDSCVIRRAPIGIRQSKWRERAQHNRLVVPTNSYDCMTSFRTICKTDK